LTVLNGEEMLVKLWFLDQRLMRHLLQNSCDSWYKNCSGRRCTLWR